MNLDVNKRIRQVRKLLGYSQRDIAEILGKKLSTYSQCERQGTITCGMLLQLAEIFNVDVRVLLYCDTPKNTDNITHRTEIYLTKKEENYIKVLRNLKPENRKEVIDFIDAVYRKDKCKNG